LGNGEVWRTRSKTPPGGKSWETWGREAADQRKKTLLEFGEDGQNSYKGGKGRSQGDGGRAVILEVKGGDRERRGHTS